MTDAERIADVITEMGTRFRGTLRFWGQWFGRAFDNCHHLVRCEVDGDALCLTFNEGETLRIWVPRRSAFDTAARHESGTGVFRIADAERIRWEWFYYGRPQTDANRYFMSFHKTETGIAVDTNIDWYKPDLKPMPEPPAVEVYLQ